MTAITYVGAPQAWAPFASALSSLRASLAAIEARLRAGAFGSGFAQAFPGRVASTRGWLDRLDRSGDLGAGVLAGTFESSRWASIANVQRAAMLSMAADLGDEGLVTRFVGEVVVPTIEGLGVVGGQAWQLAQDGLKAAPSLLRWLVVGLVAFAVVKVRR